MNGHADGEDGHNASNVFLRYHNDQYDRLEQCQIANLPIWEFSFSGH
jgi:hypothetical protein